MTEQHTYRYGDRVRHRKRPEWGVGAVIRTEEVTIDGERTQRVSIRFPNEGIKTLSTLHADLSVVQDEPATSPAASSRQGVADFDSMKASGWLSSMADKKVEEVMVAIAEEARDPFLDIGRRLEFTLALYRFDRSGKGLIEWAVAQSGLADPLTRFTRQELEQLFERWAHERDGHLRRLLEEVQDPNLLRQLTSAAPAEAQRAVKRVGARR